MKALVLPRPLGTLLAAPALVLAGGAADSQQLSLDWSGGILGAQVDYAFDGDPGDFVLLIPSLLPGPTFLPAAVLGAPILLEQDLDLLGIAKFGLLDAVEGVGTLSYDLPTNPLLDGVVFRAQALSFDGQTLAFESTSNPTRFKLSLPGSTHYTIGDAVLARREHGMTLLQDGRVLVSGGNVPGTQGLKHDSFELFDPRTQEFELGLGTLGGGRSYHSSTLLQDGRVLLVGGLGDGENVLGTAAIFDPQSKTVAAVTDTMSVRRVFHTATLLADGRVLVTGGSESFSPGDPLGHPLSMTGVLHPSMEVFDPVTETWSNVGFLPGGRSFHGASLLSDGRVFVTGGYGKTTFQPNAITLAETLFVDPAGGTMTQGPMMTEPRALHGQIQSGPGGALIVGGATIDVQSKTTFGVQSSVPFEKPSAQLPFAFDDPDPLPPAPEGPRTICIPRGKGYMYVILPSIAFWDDSFLTGPPGAAGGTGAQPYPLYSILDTATAWTQSGELIDWRWRAGAEKLDNQRMLILGPSGETSPGQWDRTAEMFHFP